MTETPRKPAPPSAGTDENASAAARLAAIVASLEGYDPDALPVDAAREIIGAFVQPVSLVERLGLREALDRVLAQDVLSPIDVPAHDNSAMDGYALAAASLGDGDTRLTVAGTAVAGLALLVLLCLDHLRLRAALAVARSFGPARPA